AVRSWPIAIAGPSPVTGILEPGSEDANEKSGEGPMALSPLRWRRCDQLVLAQTTLSVTSPATAAVVWISQPNLSPSMIGRLAVTLTAETAARALSSWV